VYDAIAAAHVVTRFQGASSHGLSRFVGRAPEIEQLDTALDRARRGRGEVVAIVGEPGVGKSRLIHEFTRSVAGCLVLHATTASHGRTTAYLPILGLLRALFRIDERDDARAIRQKVAEFLRVSIDLHPDIGPAALSLLDALPADEGFRQLEPPARRRRT